MHKLQGVNVQWENVLHYDYEMRKFAYEKIVELKISMSEALKKATSDVETRQHHFIERLSLATRDRPAGQPWGTAGIMDGQGGKGDGKKGKKRKGRGGKGDGKKGGKGKDGKGDGIGKGKKGKKGAKPKLNRTPDGQPICFAYNRGEDWCPGNCGMLHACQYCLGHKCAAYKCQDWKL